MRAYSRVGNLFAMYSIFVDGPVEKFVLRFDINVFQDAGFAWFVSMVCERGGCLRIFFS